ncbi:hypothetical protein CLF_104331 [Clonorchis sinensis]|uniref:Uncharacterized protein n=1 Tax=Clonorchis sinensis TaxID=79923 RepID=G7YBF3_CLOSI|nr:hypothetical protein CLF_104331 [Clonorchis sinensis]
MAREFCDENTIRNHAKVKNEDFVMKLTFVFSAHCPLRMITTSTCSKDIGLERQTNVFPLTKQSQKFMGTQCQIFNPGAIPASFHYPPEKEAEILATYYGARYKVLVFPNKIERPLTHKVIRSDNITGFVIIGNQELLDGHARCANLAYPWRVQLEAQTDKCVIRVNWAFHNELRKRLSFTGTDNAEENVHADSHRANKASQHRITLDMIINPADTSGQRSSTGGEGDLEEPDADIQALWKSEIGKTEDVTKKDVSTSEDDEEEDREDDDEVDENFGADLWMPAKRRHYQERSEERATPPKPGQRKPFILTRVWPPSLRLQNTATTGKIRFLIIGRIRRNVMGSHPSSQRTTTFHDTFTNAFGHPIHICSTCFDLRQYLVWTPCLAVIHTPWPVIHTHRDLQSGKKYLRSYIDFFGQPEETPRAPWFRRYLSCAFKDWRLLRPIVVQADGNPLNQNEPPCTLNGPENTLNPCRSQFVTIPWRIVTTITTLNYPPKMFMYGAVHEPKYGVAMTVPRLPYPV